MEFEVVGNAEGGPQLRLDWRSFSYAGKFVMTNTGKAVCREERADNGDGSEESDFADDVVAAISFNEDRTNTNVVWLRYITVREDKRGEEIGSRLAAFTASHLLDADYARVRIAVNNPFAYQALHKAGFGYTGERTGVAELVLARPCASRAANYQRGLAAYRERDLSPEEESFLDAKAGSGPPTTVDSPNARK